jgi:hypothetical protein
VNCVLVMRNEREDLVAVGPVSADLASLLLAEAR